MLSVWKGRNKTLSSSASNFLFQEYTNPVAPAVVTYGQFGSPLNPNGDAPPLFNKLVRFLQQKALNTEKIFLPQPNLDAEIQNIKKSVMKDITQLAENNDNFQLASYTKNPHVIADITKQYLSALPEPLLTFHLYDSFLLTYKMSNENDRVWGFRFLLAFLPPGFRASVKLLLTLLHRVTLSYENSRMDARALAEIFAPYFLRPEEELFYMKDDQATAVDIIALLISECDSVLKTVTNALRPAMPTPSVFPKTANANQQPTSTPQSNSPTLSRGATESHPLEILSQTPPKLKPAAGTIPGEPIIKITPAHFDHRPSIPNKVIPPTPVAAASNSANPSPAVSPRTTTPPPIVVASPLTISTPSSLSPLSHTSISTPSLLSPAPTPPLTPLDASYEMISASPAPVVSQISDPLRARGLTDFALSPSMPPQPTSSKSSLGLSTAPTLSPLIVSTPQYDSDNTAGSPTNISPISSPTITNGEATPNPKLDKLRASVSNIIVSQVTPQLIETLRGILLAETQGVAMAGARILLDTKKVLADAMATNLNATKDDVAAFISTNPRTPTILPDVEQKEDIKLAKLRQAAFGAVEQILDLLHYVKVKLAETQEAKYAVAIGHTVRALKTSLESQPSTTLSRMPSVGTVTNVLRDSSLIASGLRESSSDPLPDPTLSPTPSVPTSPTPTQQTSPPSSPTDPLQQAPIVRSHSTSTVPPPTGHNPTARPMSQSNPAVTMSPRDTVLLTLDKHAYEAHSKITQTQGCVAECSHKGLVEAARGVRFAKQCLTETMDSLSLPAIPDYRVDPVEGEDQISTLRRALPASLQKVADQINALSEHIHNNGFLDPRPIETCFGLVVRALIVPV